MLGPTALPPSRADVGHYIGICRKRVHIIGHLIASDNPRLRPCAPYAVLLYCMQLSNPSLVPRLVQSPMVILWHLITEFAPGYGQLPF